MFTCFVFQLILNHNSNQTIYIGVNEKKAVSSPNAFVHPFMRRMSVHIVVDSRPGDVCG